MLLHSPVSSNSIHYHKCELADKPDSILQSDRCWQDFACDNDLPCERRFCGYCLENVVSMSAMLMCDYD